MTQPTTSDGQPLAIPMIHRNGSSRSVLHEDLSDACDAIRLAVEACQLTAPNLRDYYLQGESAFNVAKAQHESRLRRLQDVHQELFAILEAIA